MNISNAKEISIVDYLTKLGHYHVRIRRGQYWYLSPLREETTPSFTVNDDDGEWYDFGIAEGGDLIELCKHLYHTNDVHTVLSMIERDCSGIAKEKKQEVSLSHKSMASDMTGIRLMPLRHYALQSYLQSRGIDIGIATTFCKEIHYILRYKEYFAIAFPNQSGGYEVRNPYFKGCVKSKDISMIYHINGMPQEHICVFEGFMDFLSYMTLLKKGNRTVCVDFKTDVLVMNSVANLRKSMDYLEPYKEVHCYLDNDLAGHKTVEAFAGLFVGKVKDESIRYREYKDLNDLLRGKKR